MPHVLGMFLPRPDGTRDVFCENVYRRVRPCDNYVTFDQSNELVSGMVVSLPHGSLRFCSWQCVVSYVKRTQKVR